MFRKLMYRKINNNLTTIMDYSESECNYRIKVIMIGDSGVGKTSLICKVALKTESNESKPTTGYEYFNKFYALGSEIVQVHFWDTAGQDKYKSVASNYYRKASGAIIVFDITNRQSFESMQEWYKALTNYGEEAVEILVIGNKSDLKEERKVERSEAKAFADSIMSTYIETSAISGK